MSNSVLTEMDEMCGNCGLTFGAHHACPQPWPLNYCPGHEGHADWDHGLGTIFKSTGVNRHVSVGTPAQRQVEYWRFL